MERKNHRGRARSQQFVIAPPCDIEAERAVLAAVLLEPRRSSDVMAVLEPADFADHINRTVYTALLRLQRRGLPADATLVVGELRECGQFNGDEGISAATLVDLFRLLPLVEHLPYYLQRVVEMARHRKLIVQQI